MVVKYPMFNGEFEYRVDEKGRVPVPPKFRTEELRREGVVLCPGMEKCINIYTNAEWKKIADSLTTGPMASSKMRKLNRAIFATAFNTELDAQSRITVPNQLRQYASLSDAVVITGVNTYMELWNKEQWEKEKASSQEEAWHTIETMERH